MIKIVVASNEPDLRALIEIILKSSGYHCLFVENFQEVVTLLQNSSIDLLLFRATLVDNGRELVAIEPELQKIGVIWLVTKRYGVDEERVHLEFIDRYLWIPISPEELIDAVRDVLSKYGHSEPSEATAFRRKYRLK
ncbi:MAG: hypothetical protein HS114_12845 [Anaerolineales bacterium]|nr:hypothetical protein [Anaerolineales bacterium]